MRPAQSGVVPFPPARPSPFPAGAPRLVMIGNYPPRRCGIATFTADKVAALRETMPQARIEVCAMAPAPAPNGGSQPAFETLPEVAWTIAGGDLDGYRETGIAIDAAGADAVWLQHEYGIFDGPAGDRVIDLLTPVAAPLIVTLHTVLEQPDADQERVLRWLVSRASRLVVMSHRAAAILHRRADVRRGQVIVIEHGAPDRPFGRAAEMKQALELGEVPTLLTFGLLSRGKGIETAIRAMARVLERHPDAQYVIAGATHPNLVAREGEAYRAELRQLAMALGIAERIRWIDDYLDNEELLDLIEAADIYLTPYAGAQQSTSGTLTYAVALGKAVVSTPYAHALELLDDGHGVLTPFEDPAAMAEAICGLLDDPEALRDLQMRAWRRGRPMLWANVARRAHQAILDVARRQAQPAAQPAAQPLRGQADLERLCDDTGIVQHSVLSVPDRAHGYCIDDNARALILANVTDGPFARRAPIFAAFLQHGWNAGARRFRNFMSYDRRWLEEVGSPDSNGRTLWAIGATVADARGGDLGPWAEALWREAGPIALEFTALRSLAFAMLGADRVLEARPDDGVARTVLDHGMQVLGKALATHSRDGWRWFENGLAYDNCRPAEALLAAARRAGDDRLARAALDALDWVVRQQTAPAGHYRPVGTEDFGTGRLPPSPFDQQPVDAWATVDAAALAFRHTGDPRWRDVAARAHGWFFGANDRGIALADSASGACMDGLTPHGANLNRGAESALAAHLAAWRWQSLDHAQTRAAPAPMQPAGGALKPGHE